MHVQLCTILVSRAVTLYDRPPLRFQAVDLTSQHEVTYSCFSVNKINIVQHCVHFILLLLFLLHGKFSISHSSVDGMLLLVQKMKMGTKRVVGILIY